MHARAALIDTVLREAWREHLRGSDGDWALVAVGGYGRGELHPCSDIDILLLVPAAAGRAPGAAASSGSSPSCGTSAWRSGHSVRTVAECAQESAADVSVMTTLLEARLLAGNAELLGAMRAALAPANVWPVKRVLRGQGARAGRAAPEGATTPPTTSSPTSRPGPAGCATSRPSPGSPSATSAPTSLDGLATHGFVTAGGAAPPASRRRPSCGRCASGCTSLTGRREDRLLFDHQLKLAQTFGYEDASYTLAVEQFMQRYYRTVMDVSLLNELLLQLFREAILTESEPPRPLNARFQVRNGSLEAVSDEVFARTPSALLELFVLLQQNPEINGVRASTMRAVARSLWLIDEEFRQNPRHHRLFLEILRAPVGRDARAAPHEHLRGARPLHPRLRPHRRAHAVRSVPRLYGRCAHAVRGEQSAALRDPALRPRAAGGLAHHAAAAASREIAYLAALFHDIAKGRGGDHSELGAVDAEAFCLEQGLSPYDARLVAWLVRNHLELSITSQKQDISDPQVISAFARKVGDETHLDYLYVLTCADVRGTNPKLWNSWKASLFHDFYERVKRALRRGLESPIDQEQLVRETQDAARRLLLEHEVTRGEHRAESWTRFSAGYFLQHSPEEVAWHTRLLAEREAGSDEPLVALDPRSVRGTTAVLIFTRPRRHGFARTTAVLDQLGLNIVDARITPSGDGFSLDLYHMLEDDGAPITDRDRQSEIEHALWRSLQGPADAPFAVSRRAPRQARMFNTATLISVSVDERNHRSVLELTAGDRPGLLCDVGKVLMQERIELHAAKIMTVGERAEDVFYVTDFENRPLSGAAAEQLKERLVQVLDQREAALRTPAAAGVAGA